MDSVLDDDKELLSVLLAVMLSWWLIIFKCFLIY